MIEFAEVADVLGVEKPEFIEKDYYAVKLLGLVFSLDQKNYELHFSGGTCLSKVHIDTESIPFSLGKEEQYTPEQSVYLDKLAEEALAGKDLSPPFTSVEALLDHLHAQ